MMKTQLGSTDLHVSKLGLGTVKFGRNQGVHYPQAFELPTDNEIQSLLNCAAELGINLLDTAPAYGVSETRLGQAIKNQRDKWVISTKVGELFINGQSTFDFSSSGIKKSIENSLRCLQTDYLDIVLVHSDGNDKKIIEMIDYFSILHDLKKAGVIRAIGMSTKTVEGGLLALNHADLVMVMHNPIYTAEKAVLDYAAQHHKGIFIKKAFASGHLEKISSNNAVQSTMDFIFAEPSVSSIIMGTLNQKHLIQNVTLANEALHSL